MILFLQIFLLGGVGAILRYGITQLNNNSFSYGTLLANIFGSYVIGIMYMIHHQQSDHYLKPWTIAIMIGFLGATTTFSSYALDCVKYLEKGDWALLILNFILNNLLTIMACWLAIYHFKMKYNQ